MDLYRRLILALALAATAGATALAVLLSVAWAPVLTWGIFAGALTVGAAGLARWVTVPLRELAATPGEDAVPDPRQALERLAGTQAEAEALAADRDSAVETLVRERVDGWQRANQALSLLYRAVAGDTGGGTRPYLETLLGAAAREGFPPVAGALWPDGGVFLTDTADALPDALLGASPRRSQAIVVHAGDRTWAGFPVPANPAQTGDAPRMLLAAWPGTTGPDEMTLAALGAVARYLAVRGQAVRPAAGTRPDAAELALKASFLAHVSARLQAATEAMAAFGAARAAARDTDDLLESGARLLERLTPLLDLADDGWQPAFAAPRRVSVAHLVKQVAAAHQGGPVTVWVDRATCPVLADPSPLALALEALLDEAGRHAGGAGLRVEARHAGPDTRPHGEITIHATTDTPLAPGIGMALASRLARANGGALSHHAGGGGLHLTLNWPYSPQHGPAHRAA
ncbi:MAG: hypothetical protein HZA24_12380 [Nitrospirae bacterium]|nr:hypothetical protein [Nitrospirota bacterium]